MSELGKIGCNTHIYLYAKHHYKRNNVVDDMRILMGERCGMYRKGDVDPNHLPRINDVMLVLLYDLVWPHLVKSGNPPHFFTQFMEHIHPEGTWKTGYMTNQSKLNLEQPEVFPDYDYWTAVIHASLSFLSLLTIQAIEEVEGSKLGEVDYELFPMLKTEEKIV